jgi:hypothetical protein
MINPQRHAAIVAHVTRKVAMEMPSTGVSIGAGLGALAGGALGAYTTPVDPRTGKRNRGRLIGQTIAAAITGGAVAGAGVAGMEYGRNSADFSAQGRQALDDNMRGETLRPFKPERPGPYR